MNARKVFQQKKTNECKKSFSTFTQRQSEIHKSLLTSVILISESQKLPLWYYV